MTVSQGNGSSVVSVERLCRLAEIGRASYYRNWMASQPLREETALRDVVQRLCLANRHYGYRRIGCAAAARGLVRQLQAALADHAR